MRPCRWVSDPYISSQSETAKARLGHSTDSTSGAIVLEMGRSLASLYRSGSQNPLPPSANGAFYAAWGGGFAEPQEFATRAQGLKVRPISLPRAIAPARNR